MSPKGIYYSFLAIFNLRVAFSALPWDTQLIHWWKLYMGQTATFQFAFWRFTILLVELFLILIIMSAAVETNEKKKQQNFRMAKIILFIQCWYILEYCTHYASVWIIWEQLGITGNGRSGLSSHIVTMLTFGYLGWHD